MSNPPTYQVQPGSVETQVAWLPAQAYQVPVAALVQPLPPQNPPLTGSRVPTAVLVSWVPLPPDQVLPLPRRVPPVSGAVPQNPPIVGARVPVAALMAWLPPDPLPTLSRKFATPPSGPIGQNPPFAGPIAARQISVAVAWIPPDPQPITVRNIVPISGTVLTVGPPVSNPSPPSPPVPTPFVPYRAPVSTPSSLFALFNQIVEGENPSWIDFDLYTITLFNGTVLRYTTADFPINVNGQLYTSEQVRIDQSQNKVQAHWKVGLDVDTWVVVFMPRPVDPITGATFPDTIGSIPWIKAAQGGYLDAADFQVDRAYFSPIPTWPMAPAGAVPLGTKTIFAGKVAQVDTTDIVAVITVNDYRDLMTISMPLHFFSAQCRHTLFDAGCNADGTMVRGRFQQSWTVQPGSTQNNIVATRIPLPGGSNTYALGSIIMTSGLNNTFQRTIMSWDGVNMKLSAPFPFTVNVGDSFSAAAGCDLQRGTCSAFGNLINFGGFPYIPAPETIT